MASGPLRTYRNVIDYFESICESHIAIKQFQTGTISDIDIQTETDSPTKYPMVFLVYRNGSIDKGGKVSFDFTLMVCDISKNRETLEVNRLSDTHEILMDLISKFTITDYTETEANIETPILTTPFVERFKNNLSGWAAEITISVKYPFDLCNSPYES